MVQPGICSSGFTALPGSGTPYEMNAALGAAEPIGLGAVDGPEDVILDAEDNLYCGSRDGDIIRFLAPDTRSARSSRISAGKRWALLLTATAIS